MLGQEERSIDFQDKFSTTTHEQRVIYDTPGIRQQQSMQHGYAAAAYAWTMVVAVATHQAGIRDPRTSITFTGAAAAVLPVVPQVFAYSSTSAVSTYVEHVLLVFFSLVCVTK